MVRDALVAPVPTDSWRTETWEALGTTVVLRVHAHPTAGIRALVQRELDAIDRAASRFRRDSELSRLNDARGARLAVSPLFAAALALAVKAAVVTEGRVDPTLETSLVAAGYNCDWRELTPVPSSAHSSRKSLEIVGRRRAEPWRAIELWEDPPSARLSDGIRLDLGATAKALAADRAAAAAHGASGASVLVALGGDIATGGPAPPGGWMIHVTDDHRSRPQASGQTVSIESGGLATSSITVRRWLHRGRVMHHILDPRTGEPVEAVWRTASVAAANCAEANIASTAAIVFGHLAPQWLSRQRLPARLVAMDGAVTSTGGWPT
ncbi:MAG: FAD:protein FMN transferase [Solirubrobacterales bacterium]|nr:FAD:protein FMN transferase [Solirubrobacterales bacterium]